MIRSASLRMALMAGIGLLAASGCFGPNYSEGIVCSDHGQCPPGMECGSDGRCWHPGRECTANAQCDSGVCDTETGMCTGCTADAQCDSGICDTSTGMCVEPECTADVQCDSGVCDIEAGMCAGPACGWTLQVGSAEDDRYSSAITTADGTVYAVGSTTGDMGGTGNAGDFDAVLSKVDRNGTLVWTRQFGTSLEDIAVDVIVDAHGDIYVSGYSNADIDGDGSPAAPTCGTDPYTGNCPDVFLAKYDADGNQLWLEQWGTPERRETGGKLLFDPVRGDLIMLVTSRSSNGSSYSPQIVRWDPLCGHPDPIWMYTDFWNNNPTSIAIGKDGSIYVGGRGQVAIAGALSTAGASGGVWYLFKVSAAGKTQWVTHAGSPGHDVPYDMAIDDNGDIYLSGFVQGVGDGAPEGTQYQGSDGSGWNGTGDIAVAKFSPEGSQLWFAQRGTSRNDSVLGIAVADDGSLRLASTSAGDLESGMPENTGGYDIFVTELGLDGVWGATTHVSSAQDDVAYRIRSSNGATLLAGYSTGDLEGDGSAGAMDAVLVNLCE